MKLVRIAALRHCCVRGVAFVRGGSLKWSGWSDDLFTRATAEKRFVILDLEAVWCHWCHVMEKTTYADPEVKELLASKYLAGPRRSGRQPGSVEPLRRLGLAGDHRVRP